jgi:GT2 family glycosyltransferase
LVGARLQLIKNKSNLGFAGGNNVGMRYALEHGADRVMVVNNDMIVDKDLLVYLIKAINENVGILSPKIYFAKGFEFHKEKYKKDELGRVIWYAGGEIDWDNVYGNNIGVDEVDRGQFDKKRELDFATGACCLFNAKVLREVGLFNEKFFMYFEDVELSVRIKETGYKIFYIPKAVVWHKVAQSSGIGSGLNDYFTTRNRLLFGMKYASMRTKLALERENIKLLLTGRKWQKVGIRDYYMHRFGKGSWK